MGHQHNNTKERGRNDGTLVGACHFIKTRNRSLQKSFAYTQMNTNSVPKPGFAQGAADSGLYCAATLFTSRRLTEKVLQAMCTSQMCQEITASNPLMTVRCACVQYIPAFILIWIICLTHLPEKKKKKKEVIFIHSWQVLICFSMREMLHEEALTVSVIM